MASEILTSSEMNIADRMAMCSGITGLALMESAGCRVARAILRRWAPRPTIVMCGLGNNGGDGLVVARKLADFGVKNIIVALLDESKKLRGDARVMANSWAGKTVPLEVNALRGRTLIVDALYGSGLSREITGKAAEVIKMANSMAVKRVSIDLPSGIHGDTGYILGAAFKADLTVTFFRKKLGHLLLPGRINCGEIEVTEIGIPEGVIEKISPNTYENGPIIWGKKFPSPSKFSHKYSRGHSLVVSGVGGQTGAARLAAQAAQRSGSGLVTIVSPPDALGTNAAHLTSVMCESFSDSKEFQNILNSRRRNAVLIGPGNGIKSSTKQNVLIALNSPLSCVLDADALTVFSEKPSELWESISGPCVLTPHDAEFERLFGNLPRDGGKVGRVRQAALTSGAVVLLKGADTVIASPDGRAIVNSNAPSDLATAGAGDVLSGLILGLSAQGLEPFDAAAAGAWLHGAAAGNFGPGLIAEDLSPQIPQVIQEMRYAVSKF